MRMAAPLYASVAVAMLAILLLPSPSSALTPDGWELTEAPDAELYMSPGQYVDYSELVEVINYGSYDLVLKVVSNNRTYFSQVVDPHSSMFVELVFSDITNYKITLSSQGYTLASLTKERSSFYIPPPTDSSNWHISAPDTSDPMTWTQKQVNAMLAMLTIQNVLIAVIMLSIGAVLGAAVKGVTKFLVPTDFMTWTFMAFLGVDAYLKLLGDFDRIWYIPLVVGYFIGFLLWYVQYILPVMTDCKEKTVDVRPIAVYLPDDGSGWCIQTQRNKELIKRFLGIRHRLGTDTGLNPDWVGYFKKPYLPKIRGRLLWVQKIEVMEKPARIWFFNCKEYTTGFKIAHASGIEKAQWLNEAKWYFKLQDMYDRLALKYSDLLHSHRAESTRMSAAMVEHSTMVAPAQRVSKFFGNNEPDIDLETGERILTIVESAETAKQDGIAKDTAEEGEEISYDRDSEPAHQKETKVRVKKQRRNDDEEDMEE